MKRTSLKKILAALILLLSPLTMRAQEAYAALSNNNTVLTFYYDKQKASRNGKSIGPFTSWTDRGWNGYRENITAVVFANSFARFTGLTSTAWWFDGCKNLTTIEGIENLNTANVTDMVNMFSECSSLKSLDLSDFDTANVTDMEEMFYECSSLKSLDLSGFNTAKVTNMRYMFYNCSSLTSLNLSSFNTEKVTDMNYMFENCSSLTSLDLSGFNTANVTSMYEMFSNCSSLKSLDLSGFNTAKVTTMQGMFVKCSSMTSLDLSGFNTANVTDMSGMFYECYNLTSLDLSGFNTANVTTMAYMFACCESLMTIYVGNGWSVDNLESSGVMFYDCFRLVGGNGTTYSSLHTDSDYACIDKPGQPGYLTDVKYKPREPYAVLDGNTLIFYYDTHKELRGGMSIGPFMFNNRLNVPTTSWYPQSGIITTVRFDDSFADYTELASTDCWFFGCTNLTTIDGIENLKTDNVVRMGRMFHLCRSLKTLDLSGFNTEKVTDMRDMFRVCSALTTIYVGDGWSTGQVTNGTDMFANCTSLVGGSGTRFDAGYVDHARAHIDGGTSNPGYFTKFVLGDANGDGKVTITDAVAVVNYILNTTQGTFNVAAADVDGNGSITITDAVGIVNIILNSSSAGVKERQVREEIGLEKDPD